jgi:hypothetical protein
MISRRDSQGRRHGLKHGIAAGELISRPPSVKQPGLSCGALGAYFCNDAFMAKFAF